MEPLLAGLLGVLVGALAATCAILRVLQRSGDRDLLERRLRACAEYLDCLGDLERAFHGADGDAALLEQAWSNVRAFCREVRLTGWVLAPGVRASLEAVVGELEKADPSAGTNGTGGGRAAQLLCDRYHDVARILRAEVADAERAYHRYRLLASRRDRRA